MKDKLRELAEMVREAYRAGFIAACKWPEPVSQDVDSSAYNKEFNAWSFSVREKHAAILDAEGDGGAVPVDLPQNGWIPCRKCKRVGRSNDCNRCGGSGWRLKCKSLDCAEYGCCGGQYCYISQAQVDAELARKKATQPVRSVSHEDVEECWMVLTGRAGSIAHEKDHECMMDIERKAVRAALEHFAAIAQEKQS